MPCSVREHNRPHSRKRQVYAMIRKPAVTAKALISTEGAQQKPFKGGVKSRVTHIFRVAGVETHMCQAANPGKDAEIFLITPRIFCVPSMLTMQCGF